MPKLLIAFLIFLSSISFSYSQNVEVFKFTDEELNNLKVRKVRGAKNMTEYNILTEDGGNILKACLLYTSPSPRDRYGSRMPSSA